MTTLPKPLRTYLETTVKAAREAAEKGARACLSQLAVGEATAPDYLTDELKALRRRLRAHSRAIGDVKSSNDTQPLQHLVWEVAYEHWHRMLFARFLAETGLLLWEPGAAVSLDDCEALVQEADPAMSLGAKTKWELAGKLAARMLPQVFKQHSPVFELVFAPEHQRDLERLLTGLPPEVFTASDSLGWVYQFWQAKRKDEVNASELKVGADELPAVTQLFTEPYMVDFLLHNSLGAWWVTRHPDKPHPVPLNFLRTLEDGTPAAGTFEGWPNRLKDFKLLDPCCGSGHFLVAAFLMLVPMRMDSEGLSAMDAVDAVLAENLHGLELDARCVEIAAFALAFAAWRFPDEQGTPLGVRADMPSPNVACSGLRVVTDVAELTELVPSSLPNCTRLRQELVHRYSTFRKSAVLGSLVIPETERVADLASVADEEIEPILSSAASNIDSPLEFNADESELAVAAHGLLHAHALLRARYHLVVTNVPFLARHKQDDRLKEYCDANYPFARNDLANVFLARLCELAKIGGTIQVVMPQNWLFLSAYKRERERLLRTYAWKNICRLGFSAFQIMDWWAFNTLMLTLDNSSPHGDSIVTALDASSDNDISTKIRLLQESPIANFTQESQLRNPDYRISIGQASETGLLSDFAIAPQGIKTGDDNRWRRCFWENPMVSDGWQFYQSTVNQPTLFGGREYIIDWRFEGAGMPCRRPLNEAVGNAGVAVSQMGKLPPTLYFGERYDSNVGPIIPKREEDLAAIWCYCESGEYYERIREIDQSLKVTNATLIKVEFDIERWRKVASDRYPNGLPLPYTDDHTQWLFHGHPANSPDALHVGLLRLLGYRWPIETSGTLRIDSRSIDWASKCSPLSEHGDGDGIVCLPSVRGERPAHERLLILLIHAWESTEKTSWKPTTLDDLLTKVECTGKGLDVWLKDKFFEQHARNFLQRPMVWHIWDGLKDGFGALVNYHKLNAKNLERLIHTYLGDWIRQQEAGVRERVDGAPTRLAAAQDLKRRLEAIFHGEQPHDIFVRWKSLTEQPVGWNPDINDGVRLNIRPFVTAEVLRHNKKPKLNIAWDKDRGKDVESAPWFKVFEGERINDHHLTLAEKLSAKGAR